VNARLPTAGNIVAAIHYYPDRETNVDAPVGLIQALRADDLGKAF
jgi:hypothetical protein